MCPVNLFNRALSDDKFSKSGFKVQTTTYNEQFDIKRMEICSGDEGGQRSKWGDVLTPFNSNAGQPLRLGRFKQNFYKKLQVSVLLCTSKPEWKCCPKEAPNCLVIIYWILGLGVVVEALALLSGSMCKLPYLNEHFNTRLVEIGYGVETW